MRASRFRSRVPRSRRDATGPDRAPAGLWQPVGLRGLGLLERRLGRRELCLGLLELDLVRLLLDHQQELALLDVRAIIEMLLLEEPLHAGPDRHIVEGPRRADRIDDDRHGHPPRFHHGDRRSGRHPLWLGRRVQPASPSTTVAVEHEHARITRILAAKVVEK